MREKERRKRKRGERLVNNTEPGLWTKIGSEMGGANRCGQREGEREKERDDKKEDVERDREREKEVMELE